MTAGTSPQPYPPTVGERFGHRRAEPGTRAYAAWFYHATVRRYARLVGVSASQRRRLPWRKR